MLNPFIDSDGSNPCYSRRVDVYCVMERVGKLGWKLEPAVVGKRLDSARGINQFIDLFSPSQIVRS